ncbi:MAG: ATP-binding protein [Acidobacteriota bacterium]|nr:ATP-binding protein [Acidobacteriota bacterium]
MAGREKFTLGVRLAVVLALLAVLFAGLVYLTKLDSRRMIEEVQSAIDEETDRRQELVDSWADEVSQEHAKQLAAPFLWGFETLDGVVEGTVPYDRLQKRMSQFVYGSDRPPSIETEPVGPLESVLIVDPDFRIVASSDEKAVDSRFTVPEEIAILEAARDRPQVRPGTGDPRADGTPVRELTVAVRKAGGEPIGFVRLRYVGGDIGGSPKLLKPKIQPENDNMWGPLLAGLVALLGVGFGALATSQVIALTRRIEAAAQGLRLPRARGPGGQALSLIEERLESLSQEVRRDDLLVESLTEALREGVVLLDPEGQPVTANRQAVAMLQSSERSLVSHASFSALLELNPDLAMVVHQGLEKHRPVRDLPVVLKLPSRREVAVQATTYVLRDGERTAGIIIVLKDRKSIETLEKNLLEASKLQSIVRLTGSVAHEVRNPLNVIGNHLTLLRRRLARLEPPDPGAEEKIEVLREEIDRLREILDEWLKLTAPEERAPAHAVINDVLDSVARLLRVEARHQGVDLIVDQEGEPGRVSLSTARLRQVLLNLALNGLQAMPGGGRLTLRGRRLGDSVELTVEDTGSGIPDDLKDKVFDFHFTTRHEGSGLGLPICRRLVETSGGTLAFSSEVGRGTRFTIRLPVRQAVRESRPETRSAGSI